MTETNHKQEENHLKECTDESTEEARRKMLAVKNQSSSSSSCRAASTDIPDPLSPRLPIIHRLWQVFRVKYFTEIRKIMLT